MTAVDHASNAYRFGLRHVRFGFWALLGFLSLGLVLELLLGLKLDLYVNAAHETRRLMWRLAHAHGSLTALIHLAYGGLICLLPDAASRHRRVASPCLMAATALLPGGFFLGGFGFYENDPGVGVFLAPVGAAALFLGILLAAWDTTFHSAAAASTPPGQTPGHPPAKKRDDDPWSA